jgi:hypothetical protein
LFSLLGSSPTGPPVGRAQPTSASSAMLASQLFIFQLNGTFNARRSSQIRTVVSSRRHLVFLPGLQMQPVMVILNGLTVQFDTPRGPCDTQYVL